MGLRSMMGCNDITHRRGKATCFAVLVAQNAHHLQIFAPIMAIRSMSISTEDIPIFHRWFVQDLNNR